MRRYKQTLGKLQTLREIFEDRDSISLGLIKFETMAFYYRKKISEIRNWNEKKIEKFWKEIETAKRILRKERIMAIVSERMPRGTTLDDRELNKSCGKRILQDDKHIYHRCSDLDTFSRVKPTYDNLAKGFINAEKQIEEITEREIKEKPILQVLNEPIKER